MAAFVSDILKIFPISWTSEESYGVHEPSRMVFEGLGFLLGGPRELSKYL